MHILYLFSDEAQKWGDEYLQIENWQMLGCGIVVDSRCLKAIVKALKAKGMKIGKDFQITNR